MRARAALGGLLALGWASLAWAGGPPVYYRDRVAVLTYHDVARRVPVGTDTVSPGQFAAQMALLVRDGFHPISLAQLEAFLDGHGSVPDNAVLVVFDNGYKGIATYALPVLRRYRIPATVFLIASYVGRLGNDFTWSQVRAASRTGWIRFETETYDLHRAVAIGPAATAPATVGRAWLPGGHVESWAAYRHRVLADLILARRLVEQHTGQPVNALVDPYGAYTPAFIMLARRAGYRFLFTTLGGVIAPGADPYRLPRLDVGVWDQTPAGVVGAILTVVRADAQHPFRPPASYVPVWKG